MNRIQSVSVFLFAGFLIFSWQSTASAQSGPVPLPHGAHHAKCLLDADRPLRDVENWSAQCGDPATGFHSRKASGKSENWLDTLPKCGATSKALSGCPDPLAPVEVPEFFQGKFPIEGSGTAPSCYPPSSPEFVRIGHAMFHRSCFRVLQRGDQKDLVDWNDEVTGAGPSFLYTKGCTLDKLGTIETDASGRLPKVPAQKPWVSRFVREYPPAGIPRTAADGIYRAFQDVAKAVAPGHCLARLNAGLADRMRQSMGTEFRRDPGPKGDTVFYRPNIDCREQVAMQCRLEGDECAKAKAGLKKSYEERDDGEQDFLRGLKRGDRCEPAHAEGMTLGSIDDKNLRPGAVPDGAPVIHIFNPTALFANRPFGGPSTLFHEFLHAAGAHDSPGHNHGTEENELPPGDQVYACQAIAFESFFDKLTPVKLFEACMLCADGRGRDLCRSFTPDPTNPIPDKYFGKKLSDKLGCRLH